MRYNDKIKRFVFVGSSAAVVNLLLIAFLVEVLGLKSYHLKNVANLLAIEVTVLYHFFFNRTWTWIDVPKKRGKSLFGQIAYFHLAIFVGILTRIVLFAILEKWSVFYILNVAIGIVLFALINFILCDRFIFKHSRKEESIA